MTVGESLLVRLDRCQRGATVRGQRGYWAGRRIRRRSGGIAGDHLDEVRDRQLMGFTAAIAKLDIEVGNDSPASNR